MSGRNPEPWHPVQDGESYEIRTEASRGAGLLIATVWPQLDTQANANALAAAPKLLGLAYSALVELEAVERRGELDPSGVHLIEDLHAAIDEIEGRA